METSHSWIQGLHNGVTEDCCLCICDVMYLFVVYLIALSVSQTVGGVINRKFWE
jgi:hypothetical protein